MSYRDLEIWQLARDMSIEIHRMTMKYLPKFEMYEVGSQIRRSSKSVRSNIVEGYGRRRYKQDYIRFLCYAESSCDETTDHLEILFETGSLTDKKLYDKLYDQLRQLGRMINRFIAAVEEKHNPPR
jgi:four helix bundle protein